MRIAVKDLFKPSYYNYKFWTSDYPYRKYQRRNNCIFIHIPKTAGSSILLNLNRGKWTPRDHATWQEYLARSPYYFKSLFKFSFVRNPWDRAVSIYFYLKNGGNKSRKDIYYQKKIMKHFPSFEEFVISFLDHEIIWTDKLFWPQWFFIIDNEDNLQVDFLGKFESLDKDFKFVANKLKLNTKLIKTNKSQRKSYKEYYNEITRQKIFNLYKKDILLFNYSFE